jgi:hypothetical protein
MRNMGGFGGGGGMPGGFDMDDLGTGLFKNLSFKQMTSRTGKNLPNSQSVSLCASADRSWMGCGGQCVRVVERVNVSVCTIP